MKDARVTVATARLSRRAALPRLGVAALLATTTAQAEPAGAHDATLEAESRRAGYVVIRRYRLLLGASYAEITRLVESDLMPSMREIPGFIEYILVEPGGDEHIVVSIFADQASADASAVLAREWAAGAVAELVEIPAYEVISGPVGLDVRATSAATPVP